MLVKDNNEAMERKHFIMRALDAKNMSQEDYNAEMKLLEPFIAKNLAAALVKCDEQLHSEIHQVKQMVTTDGDLKRGIAKILIKFLEKDFTNSEIKGIFRQGYKIQRLL